MEGQHEKGIAQHGKAAYTCAYSHGPEAYGLQGTVKQDNRQNQSSQGAEKKDGEAGEEGQQHFGQHIRSPPQYCIKGQEQRCIFFRNDFHGNLLNCELKSIISTIIYRYFAIFLA